MTACTCIGHRHGKIPVGGGLVTWEWVVDIPDPDCPQH